MDFGETPRNSVYHLTTLTISDRADYLDRGFTPHLLDISKQGLRAKYMRPVFPVGTPLILHFRMLIFYLDCDIPVSLSNLVALLHL